jgi:hypothetical protein
MHGAGSPFANKMMIGRYTDMEEKRIFARDIAGVPEPPSQAALSSGSAKPLKP